MKTTKSAVRKTAKAKKPTNKVVKAKKVASAKSPKDKTLFMALKFVKTEVHDPVVIQTAKGFRVTGHSDDGQPLSTIVSKVRAMEAVHNGSAKQGW